MRSERRRVIVVGGGPAGLTTATALAGSGLNVAVLERLPAAGGIPRHCPHPTFGIHEFRVPLTGPRYATKLEQRARRAGVEIHTATTVLEMDGETRSLVATSGEGLTRWEGDAIVVATGCRERPRPARKIAGSRGEGVYTTSELQQFTYLQAKRIGSKAVVYGAEHVSFSALMTLRKAGITPVAVVTAHRSHQSLAPLKQIATAFGRVPVYTSHTIASIEGAGRVTGVWIDRAAPGSRQDGGSRADGVAGIEETFIPCDTVIVSGDWVAEGDLSVRSGLTRGPHLGGIPATDPWGHTDRLGLFATGAVTRPGESAGSAATGGLRTASAVRDHLSGAVPRHRVPLLAASSHLRWVWPGWMVPGEAVAVAFRVDAWLDRCWVVLRQGDETLDRIRFRRVVPGRTLTIARTGWSRRLGDGMPVRVEIEVE